MKKNNLILAIFVFVLGIYLTACNKEEDEVTINGVKVSLNDLVGKWNLTEDLWVVDGDTTDMFIKDEITDYQPYLKLNEDKSAIWYFNRTETEYQWDIIQSQLTLGEDYYSVVKYTGNTISIKIVSPIHSNIKTFEKVKPIDFSLMEGKWEGFYIVDNKMGIINVHNLSDKISFTNDGKGVYDDGKVYDFTWNIVGDTRFNWYIDGDEMRYRFMNVDENHLVYRWGDDNYSYYEYHYVREGYKIPTNEYPKQFLILGKWIVTKIVYQTENTTEKQDYSIQFNNNGKGSLSNSSFNWSIEDNYLMINKDKYTFNKINETEMEISNGEYTLYLTKD